MFLTNIPELSIIPAVIAENPDIPRGQTKGFRYSLYSSGVGLVGFTIIIVSYY